MSDQDRTAVVSAVAFLFERIKEGKIKFFKDRTPETLKALEAVRFDDSGSPIFESITAPVRAAANAIRHVEVEKLRLELAKLELESPVQELLPEPTRVDDEVLQKCHADGEFSEFAFELHKETAIIAGIAAHCATGTEGPEPFVRNQAICVGLLIRIIKFMTAVVQITSTANRGEVVMALHRSVLESATNLRFLLLKNDGALYEEFVRASLAPERELYDRIRTNIAARNGKVLPIGERMLRSIERTCRLSQLKVEDINPKFKEWGGNLRQRLQALNEEDLYLSIQRIPSHAVHGTWVDLVLHHLEEKGGGFIPSPDWSITDPRLFCPTCTTVLAATHKYLEFAFGGTPEIRPLHERIEDLSGRLIKLDQNHEDWLSKR